MSEWRDSALCAQTDPEIFFPEAGELHSKQTKAALDICSRCPVEYECWWDAVESAEEPYGIRGGKKPAELAEAIVDRHGLEVAGSAIRQRARMAELHRVERGEQEEPDVVAEIPVQRQALEDVAEVA